MQLGRRQQQAAETRDLLVAVGTELFGAMGFGNVSAEHIAKSANVTRGALYHHFETGKDGLFAAVFEHVQRTSVVHLEAAVVDKNATGSNIRSQLSMFFRIAAEPAYQRIVLEDGPAVLGWRQWRECELRYVGNFVRKSIADADVTGRMDRTQKEMAASLIYGACCEAAMTIAASSDPIETTEIALNVMEAMIGALFAKAPGES